MKSRSWFYSFFLFVPFLLCGCDEGFRVDELSWSSDGKFLAFVAGGKIGFLDGEPPFALYPYYAEGVAAKEIAWSPLAAKLVYSTNRRGPWDLVQCDVEGKKEIFLTQDIPKDTRPVYLNGEELLFFSDREGKVEAWRILLSSNQMNPFTDPLPAPPREGAAPDGESKIEIVKKGNGVELSGTWKKKKLFWEEPALELDMPRWAPGKTPRCAFRARNRAILKDDFVAVVDFWGKREDWVALVPQDLLVFAGYFAGRGEWEKALGYDREFLRGWPDDPKGSAAYLREADFHLHVRPDLGRVQAALSTLLAKFPQSEKSEEARFLLGLTLALQKKWAESKKEFEIGSGEDSVRFAGLLSQIGIDGALLQTFFEAENEELGGDFKAAGKKFDGLTNKTVPKPLQLEAWLQLSKIAAAEKDFRGEVKAWDEVFRLVDSPELKNQARYRAALSLEKKLGEPKKAAEIYWKVGAPFRDQALRQLFYLNRAAFFDFPAAIKIGDSLLREFPESAFWDTLYDDEENLREALLRGEEKKALSAFYKGKGLEARGKTTAALAEYQKAAKGAATLELKRDALLAAAKLDQEGLKDPAKALDAQFAYVHTFDSIPDKKDWEQAMEGFGTYGLPLLKEGSAGNLDRLCASFLKGNPKNPYRVVAEGFSVLAAFLEQNWEQTEARARRFFKLLAEFRKLYQQRLGLEQKDMDQIQSLFAAAAAAACEQQQKWKEGLVFYDLVAAPEWQQYAQVRRDWINRYAASDGKLLADLLLAKTLSAKEFKFLFPDKKKQCEQILNVWFPRAKDSPMKPLGYLLLLEWIEEEGKKSPEKQELAMADADRVCRQIKAEYPGSVWEAQGLLRLAAIEEQGAFYQLEINQYNDVMARFGKEDAGGEARRRLDHLYQNQLRPPEEVKKEAAATAAEKPAPENPVAALRQRLEKKMTVKEWAALFADVESLIDQKKNLKEVKGFVEELAASKKLSAKSLAQVQWLRAKLLCADGKWGRAKPVLEKLLRDNPKEKKIIHLYYQTLRSLTVISAPVPVIASEAKQSPK